jgi:hypothetical protein
MIAIKRLVVSIGLGYNAILMMHDHLSRFEDHIQHLIEGGFARLFAGRLHPRDVAVQLARAMEDRARETDEGEKMAPDIYVVRLNAEDHSAILKAQPDLASALAEELVELARIGGLVFATYPEVKLLADESVEEHRVSVVAYSRGSRGDTTDSMPISGLDAEAGRGPDAVLILNGSQYVPLDRPIMNLGRHRDNQIIIEDSRVSRHHAQIRLRFGRFVLFDLDSSGGTMVNGHIVKEAVLQPGDVVALAGVNLIYVENSPGDDPPDEGVQTGTQPFSPTTL